MSGAARLIRATMRVGFALLLLATGMAKLLDVRGFAAVVESYAALPAPLVLPSAWALTVAEIVLGAWLLSNRRIRPASVALVALHAAYLLWVLDALRRGLSLANCGCFGVYWPRSLSWSTPLEDAVLLLLALVLWRLSHRRAT